MRLRGLVAVGSSLHMAQGLLVHRPGGPESMAFGELPARQVDAGQVRVRVQAAGVNPVDASNRADPDWGGITAPYIVGYEFAGQVIEVAADVRHVGLFDAVWGLLPVRGTRW